MVYCGRLSKACHACRRRRTSCDKIASGCSQCARRGIPCPGYRNTSELRIRDESEKVARKVHKGRGVVAYGSTEDASDLTVLLLQGTARGGPSTVGHPGYPVALASEYHSLTYFMTSYIVSSTFEPYLAQLYWTDPLSIDALSTAIRAASYAAFALHVRDHRYTVIGQTQYSEALIQANRALSDPMLAVHDRTLAAILVLGCFESVAFKGKKSLKNWTTHTMGTLELLRLRGLNQFDKPISRFMFSQASYNIRTSCIQRGVRIPPYLVELNKHIMKLPGPKDLRTMLISITDSASGLRSKFNSLEDAPSLMTEALQLDQDIAKLINNPESGITFTVLPQEQTPTWSFLGIAHSYPDRALTKHVNALRMFRILFTETVWLGATESLKNINKPGSAKAPLTSQIDMLGKFETYANKQMEDIAKAVLCSVPDFLDRQVKGEERFLRSASCLFWPLAILQRSPACPPDARDCAIMLIHKLGTDLGMPEVAKMATMPCEPGKQNWLHMYQLV